MPGLERRRRGRAPLPLCAAAVAALALAACGADVPVSTTPPPTPTPTPLPTSVASTAALGASSPVDAVQALMSSGGSTICRPQGGVQWSQAAGCPITRRLEQRLQSNATSGSGDGADPICRCQNIAPVTLAPAKAAQSGSAVVKATFQLQPPVVIYFTAVQQAQGSGWLVDDSYCADAATSIYASPVKPCT
jgi:hypothetical protein